MNLSLFTGPSRSANLTELFRRIPLGSGQVCAVVPDSTSAAALERRIAHLVGGAALDCRAYTFDRIAAAVLSRDNPPPQLIPAHLRKALIREIVKSRIGPDSRFHQVTAYPGFTGLVSPFLEEIRSGAAPAPSDPELRAVLKAFESHLSRLGMTDHEGFVNLALLGDAAERFAESFRGPLIVEGFYDLTPRQFDLIIRLAGQFRRSAVAVVCDPDRPGLFAVSSRLIAQFQERGARLIETRPEPRGMVERVLASFGKTSGAGAVSTADNAGTPPDQEQDTSFPRRRESISWTPPDQENDIQVHLFRSERSEADWIAGTIRALITEGTRAEDILVVTRQMSPAASPLPAALRRHGVPEESGGAESILAHPLIRFFFSALDASLEPDEDRIAAVQHSGYVHPANQFWKKDIPLSDRRGWSTMIADPDTPDGFAESTKKMIAALGIPESLNRGGGRLRMHREHAVFETFLHHLDEFAGFFRPLRPMMNAREFRRLLSLYLEDVPSPGGGGPGVLVTGANRARFCGRPVVFLTGLDSESFPARQRRFSLHDPATGDLLATRREQEEPLLFLMTVNGAERLYLTYPGVDDEGGIGGISSYLREILELIGGESRAIFHAGIPGAAWEGGFSNQRGRLETAVGLLAGKEHWGGDREFGETIRNAFARNQIIGKNRGLTLSNQGWRDTIAREWPPERLLSATSLERYGSCPTGFFFQDILGLAVERPVLDGLDGLERGSIIHDILARFYAGLRNTTGSSRFTEKDLPAASALMERVVEQVFDDRRSDLNRIRPLMLHAERQQIKRWMASILRLEARALGQYIPYRFEMAFGNGEIPPLVIEENGESVRLRGRIDRIDLTPGTMPQARIIDYKTGKKTTRADIVTGKALQMPLYIDAAETVLLEGTSVREGLYYNLRDAEYDEAKGVLKNCTVIREDEKKVMVDRARHSALEIARGIRSGEFPAPDKCTRFCDWRPLCRGGMKTVPGEED